MNNINYISGMDYVLCVNTELDIDVYEIAQDIIDIQLAMEDIDEELKQIFIKEN